jgi:hypothetical protein
MSGRGLAADAAMVVFPIELFLPGSDIGAVVERKAEFYQALTRWTAPATAASAAPSRAVAAQREQT